MAEARTGFEPTEIFTATAMFFNDGQLAAAANDITKLVEFFDELGARRYCERERSDVYCTN